MMVSVRQVGRPSLIATSRTPKAWPRHAARWFRDHVCTHFVFGEPAGTDRRRLKTTWVGLVLVALVVLTTAAVAWVSIWWVPAYLALMVLIFVTPQGHRQQLPETGPGEVFANLVAPDLANNLRTHSATGEYMHPRAACTSGLSMGEWPTESADLCTDLMSSTTTTPRRGRGRARKVAKVATEPLPQATSATWIRVGPGKFIRSDGHIHAFDKTHTDDPLADPHAVLDVSAVAIPALTAPAVMEQRQLPLEPLELALDDEGIAIASNDLARPVTEEHGITPSTFGPVPQVSMSVNGLGGDVFRVTVEPKAVPIPVADLDVYASWRAMDPGHHCSKGRTSRSHVGWESRRIARAIPDIDRASSQRKVRNISIPRTLTRSSFVPNTCFQQAASHAFGRLPHVQSTLQPRSPPRGKSFGSTAGRDSSPSCLAKVPAGRTRPIISLRHSTILPWISIQSN
jgi:hypothetical protein